MNYVAEYYDDVVGDYVDISDRIPDFSPELEVDIIATHITEYTGQSFAIKPQSTDSFNIESGAHFRYYRDDGVDQEYLFSGHIKNVVTNLKTGEIEFDVVPETEFLKTDDMITTPSIDTHRTRLDEARPWELGYIILGMDVDADNILDSSPTWNPNVTYPDHKFSDFLFDTLVIMNGIGYTTMICLVINKEIRFYSAEAAASALTAAQLKDIQVGTELEEIGFFDSDQVNDNLRGDGAITPPLVKPRFGTMYKKQHKIWTLEQFVIGAKLSYGGTEYGIITGIRSEKNMFEYTLTEKVFVSA